MSSSSAARRGDVRKVLWLGGQGLVLLAKQLERGHVVWPQATSSGVSRTPAQLFVLLGGHRLAHAGAHVRALARSRSLAYNDFMKKSCGEGHHKIQETSAHHPGGNREVDPGGKSWFITAE